MDTLIMLVGALLAIVSVTLGVIGAHLTALAHEDYGWRHPQTITCAVVSAFEFAIGIWISVSLLRMVGG